jgi:hypothetical protein
MDGRASEGHRGRRCGVSFAARLAKATREAYKETWQSATLERAETMARECGYAHEAVEMPGSEINWADAGMFYLEGYLQALVDFKGNVGKRIEGRDKATDAQHNDLEALRGGASTETAAEEVPS